MKCSAKNKAGKPCNAPAVGGTKRCVMHSGRAAELGSKGGRRRAVYDPDNLKELPAPKTAADLRDLLAQSIVEMRAGKMDPKLANSISSLATSFLRAAEVADSEPGQAANLQGASSFQIYEAKWLRDKRAAMAAELEKKHADQFPPSEPAQGSA